MLKDRIDHDLKSALLAGDKRLAETLRGLKSVILYAEVARGARETGLGDEEVLVLLAKEAKKRQESAHLYTKGGAADRAAAELAEKAVIEKYLPRQLSDEELSALVDELAASNNLTGPQAKGQLIGLVKQKAKGRAEGGRIAKMVNEKLWQ